jgi:hypothetical protein
VAIIVHLAAAPVVTARIYKQTQIIAVLVAIIVHLVAAPVVSVATCKMIAQTVAHVIIIVRVFTFAVRVYANI